MRNGWAAARRGRTPPIVALLAAALAMMPGRAPAAPGDCFAAGDWSARLTGYRLALHLAAAPGGALHGTLDSPDQGANGIPIDTLRCFGDSLIFFMGGIRAEFAGRREGPTLTGTWRQSGFALPLTFERGEAPAGPRRPQDPVPPLPYREDSLTWENRAAKIRLAGTLTTPHTPGRHPAALLISGSGPQDRNEALLGHRPFLVIADALTRRGFAVLRVDDRGVGGSTGSFGGSTLHDFASDAEASLAFLRGRPEVDPAAIALVGHSEGALIAPLIAARDSQVAWVVLLAGPGVPGRELLVMQGDAIRRAAGADDATRAREARLQREIFAAVESEPDSARAAVKIRALILARIAELPEATRRSLGDPGQLADAQVRTTLSPWFRALLAIDPRVALRRVRVPVLAMTGSKDLQVPPDTNLREIGQALHQGANRDVTLREMPGLNHLFQPATSGLPAEYPTIETTFAPAALETLGTWLASRAHLERSLR